MAYIVMASVVMPHIVMPRNGMAYIAMACIVMACTVMACIVIAYTDMACKGRSRICRRDAGASHRRARSTAARRFRAVHIV